MAAYPLSRIVIRLRQILRSYADWLMLSFVLVVIVCVAYGTVSIPEISTPMLGDRLQTLPVTPAQPGAFGYQWAYGNNPTQEPAPTLNPAQQGVLQYLEVHERVDQAPTLWDQVVQAVRDYVRAYSRLHDH